MVQESRGASKVTGIPARMGERLRLFPVPPCFAGRSRGVRWRGYRSDVAEDCDVLAGFREAQGRFPEAAEEWRQVIRIRSREPAGYLGLARSLIAAGRGAEAKEPILSLLGRPWPERFGKVQEEARKLLEKAGGNP
jgi:hypothetical protein